MKILTDVLILLVSIMHFGFLILEMFLWQKPLGLKIFRNSPEKAQLTAVLAANQGLYNGFLAMGLFLSFWMRDPLPVQVYFLSCVIVAGVYGAWTVSRRILFIQALPAVIALSLVLL